VPRKSAGLKVTEQPRGVALILSRVSRFVCSANRVETFIEWHANFLSISRTFSDCRVGCSTSHSQFYVSGNHRPMSRLFANWLVSTSDSFFTWKCISSWLIRIGASLTLLNAVYASERLLSLGTEKIFAKNERIEMGRKYSGVSHQFPFSPKFYWKDHCTIRK